MRVLRNLFVGAALRSGLAWSTKIAMIAANGGANDDEGVVALLWALGMLGCLTAAGLGAALLARRRPVWMRVAGGVVAVPLAFVVLGAVDTLLKSIYPGDGLAARRALAARHRSGVDCRRTGRAPCRAIHPNTAGGSHHLRRLPLVGCAERRQRADGRLRAVQTIGLIGGMSWESSAAYYEGLNLGVEKRVGGLSSARTVMASVDFAEVTALQADERWDEVAKILVDAARGVERGGADFLMLCTTTFHRVAEQVEAAVDIPLLHLADVVAEACRVQRLDSVALIGTTFAMSRSFFTDRIAGHGIEVHVPDPRHHEAINRVIYDELVHGQVLDRSRRAVVGLIEELWDAGAGGLILGCTELELLVHQADSELPVFPCTTLHVEAALDRALG